MSRHGRLIAAIISVLALVAIGIELAVVLGNPSSTGTRAAATATAVASGTPAAAASFPATQRDRLEQGITAPTVTAQAGVVAAEVRGQFKRKGKPLLPPGSRLSIDAASFRTVSARLATVTAAVTGPEPGTWQLVLIRENGQWLLIGTREMS